MNIQYHYFKTMKTDSINSNLVKNIIFIKLKK